MREGCYVADSPGIDFWHSSPLPVVDLATVLHEKKGPRRLIHRALGVSYGCKALPRQEKY